MLSELWGWRRSEYSRLVRRYKEYRRIGWRLNNEILPGYLSKSLVETTAQKLGMLRKGKLVMGHEDEIGLVMDCSIHDRWERGRNAVLRYRADSDLDPASDEYAMVKAMLESFYTVVRVVEVLRRVGVRVADLWTEQEYLLIDMGFSVSARKGLVLATRILPFAEFVTTSGAALPVDAEVLREIRDSIVPKYKVAQEGKCILAGGRRKAADLTAAIIRLCLESGASDRIRYGPAVAEPADG
jgi:hypothetical protein